MSTLLIIILSTFLTSLISFIAVFFLFIKESVLRKIILYLVSFSTGTLLAGAFLHLLPESIEKLGNNIIVFIFVLIGFSTFFLLEQFIHWHHCHKTPSEHKQEEPFTYLILISDVIHNFIDGILIGASFVVSSAIGITTFFVIIFHEIPKNIGDFGILIHGGFKKSKALILNFISALAVIFGGIFAYFLSKNIDVSYLIPFTAGTFIYIAASDLIPEIKHHNSLKKNLLHFTFFIIGIVSIFLFRFLEIE